MVANVARGKGINSEVPPAFVGGILTAEEVLADVIPDALIDGLCGEELGRVVDRVLVLRNGRSVGAEQTRQGFGQNVLLVDARSMRAG